MLLLLGCTNDSRTTQPIRPEKNTPVSGHSQKKKKNWDWKVGIFFFTNPCDIWIFNLTSFSYLVVAITKDWLFLEIVSVTM